MLKGKKRKIFLLLCLIIIVSSAATLWYARAGKPVVKVKILDSKDGKEHYFVVTDNGRLKETASFVPDKAEVLQGVAGDFSSDIVYGRIVVTLKATKMLDAEGKKVKADAKVKAMMRKISKKTEHDIYGFTAIVDAGQYFAFVELNVNLWNPCILYHYNAETDELTELYEWDGVQLCGLALNVKEEHAQK